MDCIAHGTGQMGTLRATALRVTSGGCPQNHGTSHGLSPSGLGPCPKGLQGGGDFLYGDYFARENFVGGGISAPLLPHAHTALPVPLDFARENFRNLP